MVIAVAYDRLGDYHLAQDAAQMTYVTAFRNLSELREPAAFTGWLRRITLSQCNRMTRRKSWTEQPTDTVPDMPSTDACPNRLVERQDLWSRTQEEMAKLQESAPRRLATD